MPKVSVVVPNYNYERYLPSRLESIFNQTFQDFEVIILDDNSTDDSKRVIEKYRNHPKVTHVIYNEINSGSPFVQWNKGIEFATGEWIWIAEIDDLADRTLLEKLLLNTKNNNDVVLSYCQSYRMDASGCIKGDWSNWTDDLDKNLFKNNFVFEGLLYIEKFLYSKNTIPNASGLIFKKDIYSKVGKADEDLKYCADWLLWLKLLTLGNIAFYAEKLNYFRYHQKSVIALKEKFVRFLKKKPFLFNDKIRYAELILFFCNIISKDCEFEAYCLKNKGLKMRSIKYMFEALIYGKNKIRISYILVFKYILPKNIQSFVARAKNIFNS